MKTNAIIFFYLSIFSFYSCQSVHQPLIAKDENNAIEQANNLFVFVGELVKLDTILQKEDKPQRRAIYKILQSVYGHYPSNFIEFTTEGDYGLFQLSDYKNVLLFVLIDDANKKIHYLNKFYDVYKTKNGRWAGKYNVEDFRSKIKPQKIDFEKQIIFPVNPVIEEDWIDCLYPVPYYKLKGDSAIVIFGNYVEDLFFIQKEWSLHDYFKEVEKFEVPETQIAEVKPGEVNKKIPEFLATWQTQFIKNFKGDFKKYDSFSLDSILINDSLASPTMLISKDMINDSMIKSLNNYGRTFVYSKIDSGALLLLSNIKNQLSDKGSKHFFFVVEIQKDYIRSIKKMVRFTFIETKKGYRLYSCNNYERSICWSAD